MKRAADAKNGKRIAIGIISGSIVSLVLTVALTAVISALILSEKINVAAMGYSVMGVLMLSSVIGATVANMQINGKRMIVAAAVAGCYFVELLCITALFFGGMYKGVAPTAAVVFGGGIIAGLIPAGKRGAGKVKMYKKTYS